MVKIVAPLRVHSKPSGFARGDKSRIIQIALRDQHQLLSERGTETLDFSGQLLEEVNRGAIDQRVDRVQAQAVDMIIAQPHERVVAKEPSDLKQIAPSRLTAPPQGVLCAAIRYGPKICPRNFQPGRSGCIRRPAEQQDPLRVQRSRNA